MSHGHDVQKMGDFLLTHTHNNSIIYEYPIHSCSTEPRPPDCVRGSMELTREKSGSEPLHRAGPHSEREAEEAGLGRAIIASLLLNRGLSKTLKC